MVLTFGIGAAGIGRSARLFRQISLPRSAKRQSHRAYVRILCANYFGAGFAKSSADGGLEKFRYVATS